MWWNNFNIILLFSYHLITIIIFSSIFKLSRYTFVLWMNSLFSLCMFSQNLKYEILLRFIDIVLSIIFRCNISWSYILEKEWRWCKNVGLKRFVVWKCYFWKSSATKTCYLSEYVVTSPIYPETSMVHDLQYGCNITMSYALMPGVEKIGGRIIFLP